MPGSSGSINRTLPGLDMSDVIDFNRFRNGDPGAVARMVTQVTEAGIGLLPIEVFHETPSCEISGNLEVILDYRHNANLKGEWLQAAVTLQDARFFGIFASPRFGPDQRSIVGSAFNMTPAFLDTTPPESPPTAIDSKQAFLIGGRGGQVYGHWLLDFIPQMMTVLRIGDLYGHDGPIFVANCPAYARSLIEFLELTERCIFLSPADHYRVENLICPLITKLGRRYSASVLTRCFAALGPKDEIISTKRILVGRRKQPFVSNFSELSDRLQSRGFDLIYPEDHSLEDQFRIFRAAKVIVGEDGSALHNAGFCQPGGKLVIYSRANKVNYWHAAVAESAGLSLTYLQSDIDGANHRAPVDDICRYLEE